MRPVALLATCALLVSACGNDRASSGQAGQGHALLLAASGACITGDTPEPPEPDEPEPDERHARLEPADPTDACAVSDTTITRAEDQILARAGAAGPVRATPWDHRSKPARLDDVTTRFALTTDEKSALSRNGFVVPARLELPSYAAAFHEIYQSEMPLFVSMDAILHAIFRGNDHILVLLEARRLEPVLRRTLAILHCALPGAAGAYPAETALDLDVYVSVARSLLADHLVPPTYAESGIAVRELFAQAKAAKGVVEVGLFGRARKVDFSMFTPRGHYAGDDHLAPYFRAVTWLSRVELNVVSRSSRSSAATEVADPRETPREAIDALALSDLVARAGVSEAVESLDAAYRLFAGPREDVSASDLVELRRQARITDLHDAGAFERLSGVIGDRFVRTTRLHVMPEGTTTLPVIATLLGARAAPDNAALARLVAPALPGRHHVGALDVGYALGQDRARTHLEAEIAMVPKLGARLDEARALAAAAGTEDLHGAWLRAILALAERPAGAVPTFMRTDAFADLRLGSTLVAFGQLRHASVLLAGQAYDQGGCAIPDAYVEPAPLALRALVAYADRGAAAMTTIDPGDTARARAYFAALGRKLRVLEVIVAGELQGRALSDAERRWLSMILEMSPGQTSAPPTYTGWYFDLFPARLEALARADFIADYFTSEDDGVDYVGTEAPRLGVFIVDTGGPARAVVGPVAHGYGHHENQLAKRLSDEAALRLASVEEPWSASYVVPAAAAPALTMQFDGEVATVTATSALGPVTIEVLDHHRRVLQAITKIATEGETKLTFRTPVSTGSPAGAPTDERPIEALHLHVGGYDAWVETASGGGATIDTTTPAE